MLRDVIPFADIWRTLRKDSRTGSAIASFVKFIENKTGAEMVYNAAHFPYMQTELADLFEIAEKLRAAGIVRAFAPRHSPSDEPQIREWHIRYRDAEESFAGGTTLDDDRAALSAALAEATERHIWFEMTDYFVDERRASRADISQIGEMLAPERFTGFSDEFRHAHPRYELRDVPYTWLRGTNLLEKTPVYLPAQVISGSERLRHARHKDEPTIVYPITTGLATWPTQEGAYLRGIVEGIERDAFMVTWLNQLSPPRFDVEALCARNPALSKLVAHVRRYRLEPHFVRLVTDAPTHVICAILEDTTGNAPRFGIGLKAGADAANAAEGAIFEALRGRRGARLFLGQKNEGDAPVAMRDVGHYRRVLYWAEKNCAERLAFLIAGATQDIREPWDTDSESAHLQRLLTWIREKGYACAAVSFTRSKANLTPWHIELTIIPELHPMHFREHEPYLGGKRLTEVPRALGYTPRNKPYLDDPHPFA